MISKSQFVLVANSKKSTSIKKYICKDTGQTVFTNVSNKAISPFTGASYLEPSKLATTASLDKNDLAKYKVISKCKDCTTEWKANKAFALTHDHFNCLVCNAELEVVENPEELEQVIQDAIEEEINKEEQSPTEEMQNMVESIDNMDDDQEIEIDLDGYEPEDVNEDEVEIEESHAEDGDTTEEELEEMYEPEEGVISITDEGEDTEQQIELEEPTEEPTEESEKEESEFEEKEGVEVTPENVDEVKVESETAEDEVSAPETAEEMELPKELEEPEDKESEASLNFNLATILNKKEYQDKIEFVMSSLDETSPLYYILVNKTPVAKAEFKKASESVKSFFIKPEIFVEAFLATLSEFKSGDKTKSLNEFGVSPIVVPTISQKSVVAYHIGKEKKKLQASFKEKEKEMLSKFKQSFSIAALLACKGQSLDEESRGKSLLTKAFLTESLRQSGINGSEALIEESFKRGIIKDFGPIVSAAWALYEKPAEFRDEMARYAQVASYQESENSNIQAPSVSVKTGASMSQRDSSGYLRSESKVLPEYDVFKKIQADVKAGLIL